MPAVPSLRLSLNGLCPSQAHVFVYLLMTLSLLQLSTSSCSTHHHVKHHLVNHVVTPRFRQRLHQFAALLLPGQM